jgi:uncharacterized protein YuzE
MKLTYDAEANAAYLSVNPEGTRPGESVRRDTHGPFVFDYDADGKLLGIEVLGARTVLRETALTYKDYRTVPPTDAEVDAHDDNGGDFLVSFDHRSGGPCCRVMGGVTAKKYAAYQRGNPRRRVWYGRPIDWDGNAVPWPVVKP